MALVNKKFKNKMFKFGLVQAWEFFAFNYPTCHILIVVNHCKPNYTSEAINRLTLETIQKNTTHIDYSHNRLDNLPYSCINYDELWRFLWW